MVPWSPTISNNNNNNNNNTSSSSIRQNPKNVVTRKLPHNPPISTTCLNGPESPPVLFNANERNSCYGRGCPTMDEDEETCRSCHSTAMVTDWSQGDKICTNCGVVAESRMMDDRPEWKDFNDAEDIIKGLPSKSRSGLVPVDETKYVGGLQPTILSKSAFGENSGGYKMAQIRKQLKTTNKKLDHLMDKAHKRALHDAQLDRRVRMKKGIEKEKEGGTNTNNADADFNSSVRPEFDMVVVQEEEDAHRLQAAIYADKWSLDRAILLHGTSQDSFGGKNYSEMGENREDVLSQMDSKLKIASRDLYYSYSLITEAARKINIPSRVIDEAIHRLVRYVTRRDGFSVKGVSSRLSKENKNESKEERKAATVRLREYNKVKQTSSLGAAILFLTTRNLGWTRTMVEICNCFHPTLEYTKETILIKPKHCSCAMNEIKAYFPEYARIPIGSNATGDSHSSTNNYDSISTSNFADHFIRNLQLPPVAEASIRALLVHCRNEQIQLGRNSGTKMSTMCAAVAYFVCAAGAVMQKVAKQVHLKNDGTSKTSSQSGSATAQSNININSTGKLKGKIELSEHPQEDPTKDSDDDDDGDDEDKEEEEMEEKELFDVFTHDAVVENQQEKLEYNMRRMWDAWAEQMPWSRSLLEIEQSCGVSKIIVSKLYKTDMYPRRECLLNVLRDAVSGEGILKSECVNESGSSLRQTPLATILLAHISTSGTLMNSK
jgi:transcription initiation factor TFIIIB Brf1 subunit/transcription initiation factor TFIIB